MLSRCAAAEVLGVGVGDTDEEIRAAYRKIALSCHPDEQRGGGEARRARERFREVQFTLSTRKCKWLPLTRSLTRWLAHSLSHTLSHAFIIAKGSCAAAVRVLLSAGCMSEVEVHGLAYRLPQPKP